MHEQRDWYDTPLYYDIIFDVETQREADFLEVVHERFGTGSRSRQILEPACGSGRLVLEMARRGWKVSGFDGNARTLEFTRDRLRKASLKARLWEDWMQSFSLPKAQTFDLAHCLVSSFKYLHREADAVACLKGVAACLKSGGLFVLGIHLSDYERQSVEHERWVAARDDTRVICNIRTWPANRRTRLEDLRTRLQITRAGRTHWQETRWQFRTYDAAQVRSLLRKVPALELLACYDFTCDIEAPRKLDNRSTDCVLVLRKKSDP